MVTMPTAANSGDDAEDLRRLAAYAARLADAVEAALPGWVERSVAERWQAWRGVPLPPEVHDAARRAGRAACEEVSPRVRDLLVSDVDAQRANPLALIRDALGHPTRVLSEAGVPPVARDEHAERMFPDDVYDLAPASFADLDPAVHEPGLEWGAAKAHVVLARRRREGKR